MRDSLIQLLQAILEVVIVLLTPYIIKMLKAMEQKAISTAGANNYSFAKEFIIDIIKTKADTFTEEELVNLVDDMDNKLGDKLSRTEIETIVHSVMVDLKKEITKE